MIRTVSAADAPAISTIYNHYIENTCITFETAPLSQEGMAERIAAVVTDYPWLVWEQAGEVVGFAYANQWKARAAFRYTVEASVYLQPQATGQGIGRRLYESLLTQLREQQFHLVVAAITLPNEPSIALHRKLGFEEMGRLKESGRKFNRWIDVGYWQLEL